MYTANSIRNICLLGHSGSGKTALTESLLYMTGVIARMGRPADGNTVSDYDSEEVKRQISLSTDKHIKTPADLAGINLRMPNSDAWVFLGTAMGVNPTPIGFNDLYLALQTGTVEGQDNPLPTVKSAKFYEVQKSISLTNHLVDSVWPTINMNTWNKLTDTQKAWVLEAVEAPAAEVTE